MWTVVGWMDEWVSRREDGKLYSNQIQNKAWAGHHIRLLSPDSLLPSITRIQACPQSIFSLHFWYHCDFFCLGTSTTEEASLLAKKSGANTISHWNSKQIPLSTMEFPNHTQREEWLAEIAIEILAK